MKVAILLLLVAAASASPILETVELIQLRNAVDQLVVNVLEYVRWLLNRHEPYSFPSTPTQTLKDDNVNLQFSTKNVLLSNAKDFVVDKVANNLPKLTSSFAVTVPNAHLEGEYDVQGTAYGKDLKGSGTFKASVSNFKLSGDIQFTIKDHSLQIETLSGDYSLDSAQFDIQGLEIEGYTQDQINELLNKQFVEYLNNNKADVEAKVINVLQPQINQLLLGHSLQDVLNFMKQLVASTPDPPPFPTLATY